MPQVRDPKTGRYTSGGSSSYEAGASAGTNSRIQKAKAMGGGAAAGSGATGAPQVTEHMQSVSNSLYSELHGAVDPYDGTKLQVVSPNKYAVTIQGNGYSDKVWSERTDEFRWEQNGSYKASFKTAEEAVSAVLKSYKSEGFKK